LPAELHVQRVDHVTGLKIDFVFLKPRNFNQEEFRRKKKAMVWGVALYIATPEDIALSELEWKKRGESSGKSRMQQGSLKFVLTNSTFPTSKNGSQNWASLLSGPAPANWPTSNKKSRHKIY
jgi:hypothetical protein